MSAEIVMSGKSEVVNVIKSKQFQSLLAVLPFVATVLFPVSVLAEEGSSNHEKTGVVESALRCQTVDDCMRVPNSPRDCCYGRAIAKSYHTQYQREFSEMLQSNHLYCAKRRMMCPQRELLCRAKKCVLLEAIGR